MLCVRRATANDTAAIESMVADFVTGHPAESHPGHRTLGVSPTLVSIHKVGRGCHLSGRAFQIFAELDGLPVRELERRLPSKELGLQPADQ